jgi:UDP-2-acetamido-3-amino-2,3-dideoxy-glucuronate N-acetyltransferase
MSVRIHPTAHVEEGCVIGDGTSIWDSVHIRHGTNIGDQCIIGGKSIIAYDVKIGHRCKINSAVYICTGVTLQDGVMVSAGTIFTNDRFPRAASSDLLHLQSSDPNEHTEQTLVCSGATIGAGCIIGSDLKIGRWAMIGMGSIVTKSVPDFHLVLGTPARSIGFVCRCGQLLSMFSDSDPAEETHVCKSCSDQYVRSGKDIRWIEPAQTLGR